MSALIFILLFGLVLTAFLPPFVSSSKFFPVLKPEKLPDGTLEEVPDTRESVTSSVLRAAS